MDLTQESFAGNPQIALGQPLTASQVAEVQRIGAEWWEFGTSTDRCDRAVGERAVRAAYREAGLAEPAIVWMDSPLGGALVAASIKGAGNRRGKLWDQLRSQLGDQLWDQLRSQLGDQLWDQLRDQIGGPLGGPLRGPLRGQIWEQIGEQLRSQLSGQLRDQLREQLGDQLSDQLWDQLSGQLSDQLWDQLSGQFRGHLGSQLSGRLGEQLGEQLRDQLDLEMSAWADGYWLAYYTCALPLAGLQRSPRLDALAVACRNIGWWWPMRGVAVLTDRPTVLSMDQQARLHCETGPALAYADGYAMHSWHGTRVPADLIESGWDTTRIMFEPNAEIRRCAIERYGWDRFVIDSGFTLADECDDPGNPGQRLRLFDVPRQVVDLPVRVLVAHNATRERDGSRHTFGLTVPTDCRNALSAVAWTFGLSEREYASLVRAS